MKKQDISDIQSFIDDEISPIDALNVFGCFRLGARIFDLKKAGHDIISKMIELPNGKRIAEYSLKV